MEKVITDKELGKIVLTRNVRAKRYLIRIVHGQIRVTIPAVGTERETLRLIESNRALLREKLLQYAGEKPKRLDESTDWQTASFRIHIFRADRSNYYMCLKNQVLEIACPQDTDFDQENVQQVLKDFLTKAFRYEANRLLPERLAELARQYHFSFSQVKINNSRGRWGSCSTRKSINLSLYLMLLPWPLIDYVLLHELCHTVEMNHSDRFWRLMDRVTDSKAHALRRELKNYPISLFK
ncbi:MAG: M48 family metallopeptidase [Parabacteroides sp.]